MTTSPRLAAIVVAAAAVLLGGCSRDHSLRCEPSERYARAGSTGDVRVPDDLTPPDDTDALQLPSAEAAAAGSGEKPCLESPPKFTPTGGRNRPTTAPPPPAAPAPAGGGDREINN